MNPNILAGLMKRVYSHFDMGTFENRLKLQKFVYFLQHGFGLNLGYEFTWYTYGPYSVDLMKEGFQAEFDSAPSIGFKDSQSELRFKKFLEFFQERAEDPLWLEIASSIHLLQRLDPSRSDKEIIDQIKQKRPYLGGKEKEIFSIFTELKQKGLVKCKQKN